MHVESLTTSLKVQPCFAVSIKTKEPWSTNGEFMAEQAVNKMNTRSVKVKFILVQDYA